MLQVQELQALDAQKAACEKVKESAFLGYAVWNVMDHHDGGSGPQLTRNALNKRPLIPSHVNNLVNRFSQGKQPLLDANCIVVGVRKEWLLISSLVTRVQDLQLDTHIQWLPTAHGQSAILYNGQHRIEANLKRIKQYMDLKKSGEKNRVGAPQVQELAEYLSREKYWGVKLFDIGLYLVHHCCPFGTHSGDPFSRVGTIAESRWHYEIEYELVSNALVFKNDSSEQTLVFTLNMLRTQQPDELETFCQTLQPMKLRGILQQVLLDPWLRQILIRLYEYNVFAIAKELTHRMYNLWNGHKGVVGGVCLFPTIFLCITMSKTIFADHAVHARVWPTTPGLPLHSCQTAVIQTPPPAQSHYP